MSTTGFPQGSRSQRRHSAWLIVLALMVAPALTPLTQRLGFSVAQQAGQNKRSEHPPKKVSGAGLDLTVSLRRSNELDADTRRYELPPVDDIRQAFEPPTKPDSLRSPPSILFL